MDSLLNKISKAQSFPHVIKISPNEFNELKYDEVLSGFVLKGFNNILFLPYTDYENVYQNNFVIVSLPRANTKEKEFVLTQKMFTKLKEYGYVPDHFERHRNLYYIQNPSEKFYTVLQNIPSYSN